MKIPFKLKLGVVVLFTMALIVPIKSFALDANDQGLMRIDKQLIEDNLQTLRENIADQYSDAWKNGNAYNYRQALSNKTIDPEDLNYYRTHAFDEAQEIYNSVQEIKRLVKEFNNKYYHDAEAASPFSADRLTETLQNAGYVEKEDTLTLGFRGENFWGTDFTVLEWTTSKFSQRSSVAPSDKDHEERHGSGSKSHGKYSRRNRGDDDEDSDSHSDKKKSDGKDCDKRSGVETFFDNLMPWVGVVGGGFAARSNYKLKKDMLRTGERLLNQAAARGNSPYTILPVMQAAMHYDPFGPVFESTLTPSLMAMTELHNRSNGKSGKASQSEFAQHYANKFRMQRMMEMVRQARAQSNTSSSSNSNFNYTFQKAIEGLKGLDRAFLPMDQMLDQMEDRLGGIQKEMNGGMSSRQRQELLNVVSNLSNGIKSQEMFNKNMSMIFDQMRMLAGQAKESARNQEALINGQGGITTTISGSNSDVFNSQFNRVGNPGVPYMNGGPVYGGGQAGGQVMYRGPGGQGVFVGVGR